MTPPSKHELRARKKMKQLCDESTKQPLDWRSVWHLAVDLTAAAVTELERRKHKRN